ncbi:TonB-dependent receptor domain-containing protein [Allosphingosinicella deserti]|uniref:TonB-dependent receptor n=1 Tax=Allosphingosinicella deserti TaxID=2116704 RepID=A0A2P7R008_9SPHN|nr:TonB-dependent receptor [Sphingomonas deserti]PSJ43535.1 TonB-dependent receptor [Sphingomonas deserti]
MRKTGLLGTSAIRSAVFVAASVAAFTPALAQTAPEDDETASGAQSEAEIESNTAVDDGSTDQVITITGSRIRRPNLESTVPITSIGGEEFFETGNVSVGDVLNDLPALRSTFSQSNSTRFLGTAGLNLVDLRGLGTQRSLVLVNGRRHVAGDILNNAVSTDINTIPADLIERVDVVTGGNSAVYGSDAIAGVVNFVLKRNFEGAQVRGQGGVSSYGDAGSYFGSVLLGKNFAGDRGNIAINAEYAHQNQYFGSSRPNIARQDGFIVVDTDPIGSDGNPDRVFFRDFRSATLNNTGLVQFGRDANAAFNCGRAANGSFFNCPYQFQTDGTLVPVTGTRVGIGPNGNFIGGNGENFRGGEQFQLAPKLDRYNVNLLAHFTVSDAFEPFIEAKYSRTETYGSGNSGPAFITGTTLGSSRERVRLDNPYLSAQARGVLTENFLRSAVNVNTGAAFEDIENEDGSITTAAAQLAAQRAAVTAGTFRFNLRENLLGLGVRAEEAVRETWRGVAGVRGTFNDDWQYEVSANYGEFKEKTEVQGNLNVQRFLLAADAARDPSNGQIRCRSQFDPSAAIAYVDGSPLLAGDVAACTPLNLFGGQFTQAQRDYLLQNTTSVGKITQFVGNAFVSGDLSQLFELPAGPIGFALGAEYRRETNSFRADPLVEEGYTFYNALPGFNPPAFEVKEAFAEIRIPVLKDVPFFQNLEISGAGRVADYSGATGTVFAYNAGVDWSPIRDLHLRGNYSRAVRAPNLVELYSAQGQNFAPGFVDPCSERNIGTGSATRAANCAAAGRPAGYDFVYNGSLEIVSGGNPDLREETSKSWTLGGVFTPRFIPGLSVSVDYYNITVDNVISSITAQDIADQCYDQASLENPYCDLFERAGAGGGPNGEIPFQILEASLLQSSLNFAQLKARGIDTEIAYRHTFDFGQLDTRLTYTHVLQRDDFINPVDPTFADQILYELGDPKDTFNFRADLKVGAYTFGYRLNFIGKQVLNFAEDIYSVQGRDPENADYADRDFYPKVFYHDFRVAIDASDKFNFYLGVDNAFNRKPPLGLTGIGGGSGIYDLRGRFFYGGVVAKF